MEMKQKNANVNGLTSRKNNGAVLLISYADSKFRDTLRRNVGAYIIDAREKGWSQNEEFRSETLKAEFGKRYALVPSLAISSEETDEEWVNKIVPVIQKITETIEAGRSVIITTFNMTQLKLIGHFLLSAKADANVWLKWENTTNGQQGMSKQRLMKDSDLADTVAKLFARFEAKRAISNDEENPFAGL